LYPTFITPWKNVSEIKSSGVGANYISKSNLVSDLFVESFDPVRSCEKFGGSNCSELYSEIVNRRCSSLVNKSIFPEEYITIPGVSPTAVVIDRPLGTFAEYKPSKNLLSTVSFSSPPAYFDLLPQTALPGLKAEPVLTTIFSSPLVFESGGGDVSEYDNTEFGVIEFIRAKLEKNSEFGCAGFESPFYYQTCMNLMKCKRFNPPFQGKNFLDFCPKTLSGGKIKMNKKFHTFFKTTKNAKDLAFGIKEPKHFNYVDFCDVEKLYLANRVGLFKQMNDSFLLEIEIDKKYPGGLLPGLKLTNQKILTWEDHWIDANSKEMVDPRIVSINLQKNSLAHANFNLPRAELTHLNLEGNLNLQAVIITEAPKLETLNMSNCPALNVINLGLNKNLKALLAKNCQLPPLVQERLLRGLYTHKNLQFKFFI
jgi:hypothetical protein